MFERKLNYYVAPDLLSQRNYVPQEIMEAVSGHFGISIEEINSKSRKHGIVLARHICAYLMRKRTSLKLVQIGQVMGDIDHTTVLHAMKAIENYIDTDNEYAVYHLNAIMDKIGINTNAHA